MLAKNVMMEVGREKTGVNKWNKPKNYRPNVHCTLPRSRLWFGSQATENDTKEKIKMVNLCDHK